MAVKLEREKLTLIQTCDGELFPIKKDILVNFVALTAIIDDTVDNGEILKISKLNKYIFKKIIELLEHQVYFAKKEEMVKAMQSGGKYEKIKTKATEDLKEEGTAWETTFTTVDVSTLVQLCLGANFLNCQKSLEYFTNAIKEILKRRTPQQSREHCNIENDFTPAEEEKVRKDNNWTETPFTEKQATAAT